MKLKIDLIIPDMYILDTVHTDSIVVCLYEDDWPLRGVPSFIDWRLNGKISKLKEKGWITSRKGEKVLCTLGKKFPFNTMLILGMGVSNKLFSTQDLLYAYKETLETLLKLKIHSFIFEIVAKNYIPIPSPTERVQLLLELFKESSLYYEIILVESWEAQRQIKEFLNITRVLR